MVFTFSIMDGTKTSGSIRMYPALLPQDFISMYFHGQTQYYMAPESAGWHVENSMFESLLILTTMKYRHIPCSVLFSFIICILSNCVMFSKKTYEKCQMTISLFLSTFHGNINRRRSPIS